MLLVTSLWEWKGSSTGFVASFSEPFLIISVSPTGPGQKQIEQGNKETSPDKQDTRGLNRPCAFVPHIFGHVRDGVQQPVQRQTDLNHFRTRIVRRMFLRLAAEVFAF